MCVVAVVFVLVYHVGGGAGVTSTASKRIIGECVWGVCMGKTTKEMGKRQQKKAQRIGARSVTV